MHVRGQVQAHDNRVGLGSGAALVVSGTLSHGSKARLNVKSVRSAVVSAYFQKQLGRAGVARCGNDCAKQRPAAAAPAIGRAHRDGKEFCFIGRMTPQREPRLLTVDLQQEPAHTARRHELSDVSPRPDSLAKRAERPRMMLGRKTEIERSQRAQDDRARHSLDRPPHAAGQGDVDAAQIKRPRQTLGLVTLPPSRDPVRERKTSQNRRIGQGRLSDSVVQRRR